MTCGSPSPSSWSPMRSRSDVADLVGQRVGHVLERRPLADPVMRHCLSAAFSASSWTVSDSSVRVGGVLPPPGEAGRRTGWSARGGATTTWTGRFGSRAGWIHTIARAPVLSAASSVVFAVSVTPPCSRPAARPGPPAASCGGRRWCAAHPCSSRPHRATRPPVARRDRRASHGLVADPALELEPRVPLADRPDPLRNNGERVAVGDQQPAGDRPCSDGTPHPPAQRPSPMPVLPFEQTARSGRSPRRVHTMPNRESAGRCVVGRRAP